MKREFVINRHGKDYVLYAGLLDEAHQQGLSAIKTQLIQAPTAQNGQVAICLAEVITEKGTFSGLGDASPESVNRAFSNALVRLAETRAKARALRDAINVSMVALEELAEPALEAVDGNGTMEAAPPRLVAVPSSTSANAPAATASSAGSQPPPPIMLPVPPPAPTPAAAAASTAVAHVARGAAGQSGQGGQGSPASTAPAAVSPASPVTMPVGHTLPPGVVPLETARPRRIREASTGSNGKSPDAAPATPTQLETIAKLARSVGRIVPTGDLTRAQASDLITRLSEERYGARRG